MKQHVLVISAAALALCCAGSAFANPGDAPRAHRRQVRQEQRIEQGRRSGSLTPREAMRLERGQGRIDRMHGRMQADGRMSRRERARLDRAQDRQSRHIHRAKHNRRSR